MFKKIASFFLVILFLLSLAVAGFWYLGNIEAADLSCRMQKAKCAEVDFSVAKGEGSISIAARLEKAGLIRHQLAFRIMLIIDGIAPRIQFGDFKLKPSLSAKEIALRLTSGTADLWITFPEGWRREEVARRILANFPGFDYQKFLSLTKDEEGYLFPDTYSVSKTADAAKLVSLFEANFNKHFLPEWETQLAKRKMTKKDAVILASIVEREARRPADRAIVAGILLNRLNEDWALQVDASVQYFLGTANCARVPLTGNCDYWPTVLKGDLKLKSPFNTYLNKGLPFAPICNPGSDSMKAVVYPTPSDYWFYISDKQGIMHYARTAAEHQANVEKYIE